MTSANATPGIIHLIDPATFKAIPLAQRAGIYTRRSHADDDDRNASLTEQRAEALDAADELDLTVGVEYCEGEGVGASRHSRRDRPVWRAALDALASGRISTLIVYELSRADRRGVFGTDLGALIERRMPGRVYVVDDRLDTADDRDRDRLIRSIEDARREAEKISRRVRRTKRRRRRAGMWLGGRPPLGLRAVTDAHGRQTGLLERDPDTYPLARRIAELLLSGQSAHRVASTLNAEGIPAPRASVWHASTIIRLARTPAWAGLAAADSRRDDAAGGWRRTGDVLTDESGEPVPLGDGTGVVTPAERARILAAVAARTEVKATRTGSTRVGGQRAASTLLGGRDGLLRCGHCHGRTEVTGPRAARYYRCAETDRVLCPGMTIPQVATDRLVAGWFLVALRVQAPSSPVLHAVATRLAHRLHPGADAARAAAQAALESARADLVRATERFLTLPDDLADAARAALDRARARVAAAERALARVPTVAPDPVDLLARLDDWDTLSLADQRALLATAIRRITAVKVGQGRRVPLTERLTVDWHDAALSDVLPFPQMAR